MERPSIPLVGQSIESGVNRVNRWISVFINISGKGARTGDILKLTSSKNGGEESRFTKNTNPGSDIENEGVSFQIDDTILPEEELIYLSLSSTKQEYHQLQM